MPHDNPLRRLPPLTQLLQTERAESAIQRHGRVLVQQWLNAALDDARRDLQSGAADDRSREEWTVHCLNRLEQQADHWRAVSFGKVINATGVILHTGLGRAPLAAAAVERIAATAAACNLEVDLETSARRYRGHQLVPLFAALTGCEDAAVVNNNAAGTLVCLAALAAGREVLISRGQLIEIGGSFRLPEIFELSGARLKEVGTTNRTRIEDYERAIGPETAAVMHVHPSNYRIEGFSGSPGIAELTELAHRHRLLAIDDIGSGALRDVTELGLPDEPTFGASIATGADVVLGSGDKLLGGPQAGILLGRREPIERIRQHPLARTVRADKLALAALAATLDVYLRGTERTDLPVWQLLSAGVDELLERAERLTSELKRIEALEVHVEQDTAPVGGGSLPGAALPTVVVALRHRGLSADDLARRLRTGLIRIYCRVQDERVLLDLRSVPPADEPDLLTGVEAALELV